MKHRISFPAAVVLIAAVSAVNAAFEAVPQSPWLLAGPASCVFPRSPLVMTASPSSIGFLDGPGAAVSASRPFGLGELDRCAAAGSSPVGRHAVAGIALTLTGGSAYSEFTLMGGCAVRIADRIALGASAAFRRLQISGYGTGTGFSGDLGMIFTPVDGIYAAGTARGAVRTRLGSSGDPACPRALELAAGVCAAPGVTVAAGFTMEENHDPCFSLCSGFSPDRAVTLGAGILTSPLRFSAAVSVSVFEIDLGYGYSGHETLPASHSLSLGWGSCAAVPNAVGEGSDAEEEITVSFPLNVNTASPEALEKIPGIGPSRASAIASWIEANGPVRTVSRLIEIPGVGPSLLETLKEYLVAE
jgi:competence ComEA-like helix-hairpin-helix protein